jgi:Carboxypeptidase regulatory-like domain
VPSPAPVGVACAARGARDERSTLPRLTPIAEERMKAKAFDFQEIIDLLNNRSVSIDSAPLVPRQGRWRRCSRVCWTGSKCVCEAEQMHPAVGRAILPVCLAASLLLSASKAGGQTVGPTTGAINGTVTDSTGAELPGVNIVVAGDALIGHSGTRTGLTNEKGLYRFPAIPPGGIHADVHAEGVQDLKRPRRATARARSPRTRLLADRNCCSRRPLSKGARVACPGKRWR